VDRITITIEPELLEGLDAFVSAKGYAGRSEALRDLLRERLKVESTEQGGDGQCLAALTYVYDHHKRQLSNRLTDMHHDHHDLTIATMHVHLDHDSCLEVAVLRGSVDQVRSLSESVISQSGVRYGHTHFVPANIAVQSHDHHAEAGGGHSHSHGDGQAHEHIRTLVWTQKP
jgi:CopG family nickel-responsive transcriptional regulator